MHNNFICSSYISLTGMTLKTLCILQKLNEMRTHTVELSNTRGKFRNHGCGLDLEVSVSRRSPDLPKVLSRSRLGQLGQRLGLGLGTERLGLGS
jgi:hypothetical protein